MPKICDHHPDGQEVLLTCDHGNVWKTSNEKTDDPKLWPTYDIGGCDCWTAPTNLLHVCYIEGITV